MPSFCDCSYNIKPIFWVFLSVRHCGLFPGIDNVDGGEKDGTRVWFETWSRGRGQSCRATYKEKEGKLRQRSKRQYSQKHSSRYPVKNGVDYQASKWKSGV